MVDGVEKKKKKTSDLYCITCHMKRAGEGDSVKVERQTDRETEL